MTNITVLLPVYNGEEFLHGTMQSILNQTYQDFEFLIVDDGSTDSSQAIVRNCDDPRIRLLVNRERLKLSGALNRGMKEAKGKYIARMDADDIALPDRLQRQFEYMERHPEIGMCGTGIEIFGSVKKRNDIYPKTVEDIKAYALFDCPFCHPTVMMRKKLFVEHDLWYDGSYYPTEDYELWARSISLFPTMNLDEVLLRYRVHDGSMTGSDWDAMDQQALRIIRGLLRKLEIECSEEELALHRNIGRGRSCQCSFAEILQADVWLQKLLEINCQKKIYEGQALSAMLSLVWYRLCFNNSSLGVKIFSRYLMGSMIKSDPMKWKRSSMLFLSVIKNKLFPFKNT